MKHEFRYSIKLWLLLMTEQYSSN